MDLFESVGESTVSTNQEALKNWTKYFTQKELDKVDLIMDTIENSRKGGAIIYPRQEQILRVFRELKPEDVRVIILGQDPYHDGNANGYAFAVTQSYTPSFKKLWESVNQSSGGYASDNNTPIKAHLHEWIKQGVMLLNTVLSVEKGLPHSHKMLGWENVIRNVLSRFSQDRNDLVFMLWGQYAQSFGPHISSITGNFILTHSHPASASYNNIKWNCNHFDLANEYFCMKNQELIYWK